MYAVLNNEQIAATAPSVFATEAHSSRSDRYAFVPTSTVLTAMRREGFEVTMASQSKTRVAGKQNFTKHMLRMRHSSALLGRQVGDVVPEIVLINSHDGASTYNLLAGLFRLVCANGAVVADSLIQSVHIRHTGDVVAEVLAASMKVLEQTGKAVEVSQSWRSLMLSQDERMALAEAAHYVRFADSNGEIETPVEPRKLLIARRNEDKGSDLWSTWNVVQENAMRGGLKGHRIDDRGRSRRVTTRGVKGIDQDVRLNTALWTLGEKMAELKAA